jgi:hypothetical protein
VDGLHQYEQAIKDILCAYSHVREGGFIVVHDCNPRSENAAARAPVPSEREWNGDVWKAIYDLRQNYPEIPYVVLDVDQGLGIIRKRNNRTYEPMYRAEYIPLPFGELARRRKELLQLTPVTDIFAIVRGIE